MAEQWFVIRGQKNLGPFTAAKLKELAAKGKLHQDDMVRQDSIRFASPAGEIDGLFQPQKPQQRTTAPSPIATTTDASNAPPPTGSNQATKLCPLCSEPIAMQAIKCKHCGSMLIPVPQQSGIASPAVPTGISTPVLVSAIGNVVLGLIWASTCFGVVLGVPMLIFSIFEFMLYSKMGRVSRSELAGSARTIGNCEIVFGLFNLVSLICGIVLLINVSKFEAQSGSP